MLSIDAVIHVISILFFNPVLATLVPISLYFSTDVSPSSFQFRSSLLYAASLWLFQILALSDRALRRGAFSKSATSRLQWEDQVIVVTGGSNGLGHACVSIMAINRARVISLDVQDPKNPIDGVRYLTCDVSSVKSVNSARDKIVAEYGPPTIVVSNAGVMKAGSILDMNLDLVQDTLAINLTSQFILAKAFVPAMTATHEPSGDKSSTSKQNKHWVTISSSLGHIGVNGLAAYCASKAGTISFHESLTAELRRHHNATIRTTLVIPGQLDSDMFRAVKNPSSFLAPTVGAFELAKTIVKKVGDGGAVDFGMPFYANWIGLMRVVPSGIQFLLRQMSGMDQAVLQIIEASDSDVAAAAAAEVEMRKTR